MFLFINTLFLQLACDEPSNKSVQEDTALLDDTASSVDTAAQAGTGDDLGFAGENFALRETEGETLIEALYMSFEAEGQYLSFGGVCNDHFGRFDIVDDELHYAEGGSTDMECPPEDNDQENALIEFMNSTPSIAYDGDTLTLTGHNATLFLDRYVP